MFELNFELREKFVNVPLVRKCGLPCPYVPYAPMVQMRILIQKAVEEFCNWLSTLINAELEISSFVDETATPVRDTIRNRIDVTLRFAPIYQSISSPLTCNNF